MNARPNQQSSETNDEESSRLIPVLRRFPRSVWMIFLGMFINRFGTFVLPFLALHMTREGYQTIQISSAMGAYGLGHLVATLLGGYLADSMGRRNTIVLSMFSGAGSMLALSQADSITSLVILAFLTGLTSELYRPASSALLSDLVSEKDRVTAFAVYRFAINAGWAFGPATAGFLAEYSYLWLFVGDALTAFLYGVIALLGLPTLGRREALSTRTQRNPIAELGESFRVAMGDIRFVRVLASSVLVAFVFMQMMTTLGLEVKVQGHPERVYGLILGLNGVIIVLLEIPLSVLSRRRSALRVMAVGNALVGLGIGCVAFSESVHGYVIAMTVFSFGEMVGMPVALAYVSQLAPERMRGRYMGIYGLAWASAITLGPSIGMFCFSRSPFLFWLGCGVIGLASALVLLVPDRAMQRIKLRSPGLALGANKY